MGETGTGARVVGYTNFILTSREAASKDDSGPYYATRGAFLTTKGQERAEKSNFALAERQEPR